MTALGKQGLHIIRQAAQAAAEIEGGDHPPLDVAAIAPLAVSIKSKRRSRRKPTAIPLPVFDREALRLKLDAASARPAPGSSELLSRPLSRELTFGYTEGGKLSNEAEVHDLTAMAPMHLKERGVSNHG